MNLPKICNKNISTGQFFLSYLSRKYRITEAKTSQNSLIYNLCFAFSAVLMWCIVLFLNVKTHMTGDDYVYSFVYQTTERLSSLGDIFESQYKHYFQWGGRSVVHVIGQALLLIHTPIIIDAINSFAFLFFIVLIYYHITAGCKKSLAIFIIIFCFVWILQPVFAETVLWITGSANYLWGTLLILSFLLPYRLFKNKNLTRFKIFLSTFFMLLFGIVAGWTNENTAAAMILMTICFIVYYNFKGWKTPLWSYSGLVGAIIGYVMMIMAPGNFARAEGISIDLLFIAYRTIIHTQSLMKYLGAFNLGVIVLLILYLKFCKQNKAVVIPYVIIYFAGVLVSIYVMIFSPGFPPRAWFGTITFNIIATGFILYNLDYSQAFMRDIRNSIFAFCIIAFGFSFYDAYKDVNTIDKIWKDRITVIDQKKKEGAKSVTFKEYQAGTKFGLGDAPYALKYMSDYYGIEIKLER